MADGYSRVSGRHGVCVGQNGPAVSNCVTGIADAIDMLISGVELVAKECELPDTLKDIAVLETSARGKSVFRLQ
jgi:glyoxylate carboligase